MTDLRRLPNLVALRAFEAAARHQNFSRAADETHAANVLVLPRPHRCRGPNVVERGRAQVGVIVRGYRQTHIDGTGH